MAFIVYDKEYIKHINVEEEYNKYKNDLQYYLNRKGRTSIRFRYYDEMIQFKNLVEKELDYIETSYYGSILTIKMKNTEEVT